MRRGLGTVKGVVHGSGPISIPLAFIPFKLNGDKLGTLQRVTLERETPNRVTGVELEVKLGDSLLARGLEGCRLAANLESDKPGRPGVTIHGGSFSEGSFWCAKNDSTSEGLVEYGHAIFHPGEVKVPLLLTEGLVDELQDLDFDEDSTDAIAQAAAEAAIDSTVQAVVDSTVAAEQARARIGPVVKAQMMDSLRAEGLRRADSARRELSRMADSTRRK